jgi:2-dehydro-3-deoxygluconokinase
MARVACIGECMIELQETRAGQLTRTYGGDTLNTAVYLARLGVTVDYVTALGDDPWSDQMIASWHREGVGTGLVIRVPGKLPGLYAIQTDPVGERRFYYWRDSAAARMLFDLPQTDSIIKLLAGYDVLYYSGITLSLYGETGRKRLFEAVASARQHGGLIVFDTNFRSRGWPDLDLATAAFRRAMDQANIILASTEDLHMLFGSDGSNEVLGREGSCEVVLKLTEPACRILCHCTDIVVRAEAVKQVVDTTAAGDSFAAAYMAARLSGTAPAEAARAGHRLAGIVVRHRGAIIPREAMLGVGLS